MNFLQGVDSRQRHGWSSKDRTALACRLAAAPAGSDGRPAVYGVRPEHFVIADDGAEAEVQVIEPTGSEIQVVAKLGGDDIIAVFRERHQFKPGDKIRLKPDPTARPSVRRDDRTTSDRLTTHKREERP